jgi:hypothetical protein
VLELVGVGVTRQEVVGAVLLLAVVKYLALAPGVEPGVAVHNQLGKLLYLPMVRLIHENSIGASSVLFG